MSAQFSRSAFSFIDRLEQDTTLTAYGDNALPLFGTALLLGIEDVSAFAVESLTDHPSDKKADIIYIDESSGIACIAQGYSAKDWGKSEAPASKASDLNTAAAWLLKAKLESVPDVIQPHAKLLREALEAKSISKLVFAYVHNAFESKNVESELQTLRSLVSSLPICGGIQIEVEELGLSRIETLFLSSSGTIQVTDEMDLQGNDIIACEKGRGWTAYMFSLNGAALYDLYDTHRSALFSANLRDFLGTRKNVGNVNSKIMKTAQQAPANFFIFNNGITIVTNKAEYLVNNKLHVYGISIVNGAQTTGAIYAAGREQAGKISVLARVITVTDQAKIGDIVAGNNTQNAILAWDRRSSDAIQLRLAREFELKGFDYVHRRDSTKRSKDDLFAEQSGQSICAFSGDLQTAIRAKAEIFENDDTYNKVFPQTLSMGHVYIVQTLARAYDDLKLKLKSKVSQEVATEIESKQFKLLDYAASKQFTIYVLGALREEIAGFKILSANAFEAASESITQDNQLLIDAWVKVLRSILPIVVQSLPADEYKVVRSTEYAKDVVKTIKGVVAGVEALQSSFLDLRGFLKGPPHTKGQPKK